MRRYYFISNDLEQIQAVMKQLEQRGFDALQMRVFSSADAEVERRRLPEGMFMKQDMVRSALLGASAGILALMVVLAIAYLSGVVQTDLGWAPFLFLALILLGFFTWIGGFRGIQEPNQRLMRFQPVLADNYHVFFVDVTRSDEKKLEQIVTGHPALRPAGVEKSWPHWILRWQQKSINAIRALP